MRKKCVGDLSASRCQQIRDMALFVVVLGVQGKRRCAGVITAKHEVGHDVSKRYVEIIPSASLPAGDSGIALLVGHHDGQSQPLGSRKQVE